MTTAETFTERNQGEACYKALQRIKAALTKGGKVLNVETSWLADDATPADQGNGTYRIDEQQWCIVTVVVDEPNADKPKKGAVA